MAQGPLWRVGWPGGSGRNGAGRAGSRVRARGPVRPMPFVCPSSRLPSLLVHPFSLPVCTARLCRHVLRTLRLVGPLGRDEARGPRGGRSAYSEPPRRLAPFLRLHKAVVDGRFERSVSGFNFIRLVWRASVASVASLGRAARVEFYPPVTNPASTFGIQAAVRNLGNS